MPQQTSEPLVQDNQNNRSWKEHLAKWTTYAAASGAALAMSTNASASIVYSSTPTVDPLAHQSNVNTNQTAPLAIKGSTFFLSMKNTTAPHRNALAALLPQGNFLTFAASLGFAKLYNLGSPIKVTGGHSANANLRRESGQPVVGAGAWGPGTVTGFAGFKTVGGDLGWVMLKVLDRNSDGYPDEVDVLGSAYNDVSGGAISAGQTSSSSTPEPNTAALGLLAAGAAGLMALRRRRVEVRKSSPTA